MQDLGDHWEVWPTSNGRARKGSMVSKVREMVANLRKDDVPLNVCIRVRLQDYGCLLKVYEEGFAWAPRLRIKEDSVVEEEIMEGCVSKRWAKSTKVIQKVSDIQLVASSVASTVRFDGMKKAHTDIKREQMPKPQSPYDELLGKLQDVFERKLENYREAQRLNDLQEQLESQLDKLRRLSPIRGEQKSSRALAKSLLEGARQLPALSSATSTEFAPAASAPRQSCTGTPTVPSNACTTGTPTSPTRRLQGRLTSSPMRDPPMRSNPQSTPSRKRSAQVLELDDKGDDVISLRLQAVKFEQLPAMPSPAMQNMPQMPAPSSQQDQSREDTAEDKKRREKLDHDAVANGDTEPLERLSMEMMTVVYSGGEPMFAWLRTADHRLKLLRLLRLRARMVFWYDQPATEFFNKEFQKMKTIVENEQWLQFTPWLDACLDRERDMMQEGSAGRFLPEIFGGQGPLVSFID